MDSNGSTNFFVKYLQLDSWSGWVSLGIITLVITIQFITLKRTQKSNSARAIEEGPTILTSLGIGGTFVGIFLGLLFFDSTNIEQSVPGLLGGLRTAFLTSVTGLIGALWIKYTEFNKSLKPHLPSDIPTEGADMDDLYATLVKINASLVGQEESSLIGQVKLARQDSNDRLDGMTRTLKEFMTQIAENNSKALIQALEEVMRDFNAKINEQFGENFKQLNLAVGKLLEWQVAYEKQLNLLIDQEAVSANQLTQSAQAFAEVLHMAGGFSKVAQDLGNLIQAFEGTQKQAEEGLRQMGNLVASAQESLPQLGQRVEDMTGNVKEMVLNLSSGIRSLMEESNRALSEGSRQFQGQLAENAKQFQAQNDESNRKMRETLMQINGEINKQSQDITTEIRQKVSDLDKTLEAELKKSLESFAGMMASLSSRFVEDYQPLTERLREVVSLARRAQ